MRCLHRTSHEAHGMRCVLHAWRTACKRGAACQECDSQGAQHAIARSVHTRTRAEYDMGCAGKICVYERNALGSGRSMPPDSFKTSISVRGSKRFGSTNLFLVSGSQPATIHYSNPGKLRVFCTLWRARHVSNVIHFCCVITSSLKKNYV